MQWLAQVCIRRPVFATVLMLLVLVVGIAGYTKLGLDEFPNIDFPVIVVTTRLPGAAPEEIETDVTDKIEGAISTISGIHDLNSRSTRARPSLPSPPPPTTTSTSPPTPSPPTSPP